mgnify:CR=1 FL=1
MLKKSVQTQDVLELINNGVNTYINDHTNEELKLEGYVITENDFVCPILFGKHFCLNYLYVDEEDGKIHLATSSVAGDLDLRFNTPIEHAVKVYNESVMFDTAKIKEYNVL